MFYLYSAISLASTSLLHLLQEKVLFLVEFVKSASWHLYKVTATMVPSPRTNQNRRLTWIRFQFDKRSSELFCIEGQWMQWMHCDSILNQMILQITCNKHESAGHWKNIDKGTIDPIVGCFCLNTLLSPKQEKNQFTQRPIKTSQELQTLSMSLSDCKSLTLNVMVV